MHWTFSDPESIFPTLETDEQAATEATLGIDCAWCGTGEGICPSCMQSLTTQSAAIAATGEHRSC